VNVGVDNNIHSAKIGAQIVRMRSSRTERILWQKVELRQRFGENHYYISIPTVDAVRRPFELHLNQLKPQAQQYERNATRAFLYAASRICREYRRHEVKSCSVHCICPPGSSFTL
jgi:hypothetical protein